MPADELTPEQMAKLGAKDAPDELTPEEMASRERKAKYPAPKSFSQSDEQLGLAGGVAYPGGGFDLSPEEEKQRKSGEVAAATDALKGIAIAGAGGIAGKVAKAAMAARGAGAVERASEVMKAAIENSFAHGTALGVAAKVAQAVAPGTVSAATTAVTKVLPAAVKGAATAGAMAAPAVAAGAARQSNLSNAVDRLRASIGASPSASAFASKLDAAATPNGTVTQGTLGGTP